MKASIHPRLLHCGLLFLALSGNTATAKAQASLCGAALAGSVLENGARSPFQTTRFAPSRPTVVAQGEVVVVGMELIAAGRTVAQVLEELRAYRRVVWHDWYCQYADGTIVHNDFRWYRTTDDVWNYFVGYPNSHDCDATVTDQFGRRLGKFCTRQAAAFARAHGGIVYVGRE